MTKQHIKKNIEDADDVVRPEDVASGKMILVTRRKDGSIVRDKAGKPIPRAFRHQQAQAAVEVAEMQQEATKLFGS